MAVTTWTFGSSGSGFYATVSFDGSNFTVSCIEGAFDLNALWFSDADGSGGEGGATLPKNDRALSMGCTKLKWDDYAKLSSLGSKTEKLNSGKSTFLTAGEDKTYSLSQLQAGGLSTSWISDWSSITLGLRATSVYGVAGTTSIKYTATPSGPPPLPDYITVGREGMWFDDNEDGVLNGDETLITALSDTDGDGYYAIKDPLFTDFATGNYTVRFVDAITPKALDLTGFGAGDKFIIDGKTNEASWYGVQESLLSLANLGPASGLNGLPVPANGGTTFFTTTGFQLVGVGIRANNTITPYITLAFDVSMLLIGSEFFGFPVIKYQGQDPEINRNITNMLAKGLEPDGGYALEVIKPSYLP